MNKNLITKISVIMILVLLFSFATRASMLASFAPQIISFIDPKAGQAANLILTAHQLSKSTSNTPITSQVVNLITPVIMDEIAKASPEAGKALKMYQQVQGFLNRGASIKNNNLKIGENSEIAEGTIEFKDKEEDVSQLVNSDLKEGSIKVSNMEVSSEKEGGDVTFTAKDKGHVEINGKKYENLKEGSKIITDRDGNIKEADMTFNEKTSLEIGGKKLDVEKGMRVTYKAGEEGKTGKTDVYGKDQTFQMDQQKITINGDNSVTIEGQKITGKDFTLDEKRFTGINGKPGEITLVDEGYLMGKNTWMEDNRMVINSEKGDVLYSKMCGDVSGFNNYVNPCKSTLTMEGEGFSTQMKEGKHFGLEIEKTDFLKYKMEGGKVVIDNGEPTFYVDTGKSVLEYNGKIVTTYEFKDGKPQEVVDPDTLAGYYDVEMSTKLARLDSESFDEETIITTKNEQAEGGQVENAKENVYVCPVGLETSGAAVTGAFFTKKCPQSVTTTSTNPEIKPGSAKKGDNWGGETIMGVYDRTADSLVVHTKDASGNINIYRINTNGVVERKVLNEWVVDKEYVLSNPEKVWFGLTEGSKTQAVNQKINTIDNTAKGITEKAGGGRQLAPAGVYFKGITRGGNWIRLEGVDGRNIIQPDGGFMNEIDGTVYVESPKGSGRYIEK